MYLWQQLRLRVALKGEDGVHKHRSFYHDTVSFVRFEDFRDSAPYAGHPGNDTGMPASEHSDDLK